MIHQPPPRPQHRRRRQRPTGAASSVASSFLLPLLLLLLIFISLRPSNIGTSSTLTTTTTTTATATTSTSPAKSNTFVVVSAFTTTITTTTITTNPRIAVPKVSIFRDRSPPVSPSTSTRSTSNSPSSIIRRQLSFLDHSNWEDIVYQTESLGNALASFSLPTPSSSSSSSTLPPPSGFLILYLAGLLTSFSPCVWGLLPLTISYISTAANERSDQRTLLPTLAFAAGLASVFCTMGMVTVLTVGTVLGSTTSNTSSGSGTTSTILPYATTTILPILSNLVCFIMGLKLLDLVDITLPSLSFLDPQTLFDTTAPSSSSDTASTRRGTGGSSSSGPILLDASGRQIIQSKKTTTSLDTQEVEQQKQSNRDNNALFRTFLLGGSSALVASPCATPVLTSILAYVANTMAITESSVSSSSSSAFLSTIGSTVVGGVLLFGYTLGYSTPLLIVAATSGQALVRLKQNQHQSQHISDSGDDPSSLSYQERSSISSFFNSIPNQIAPWVTPITGGILLYLGTTGLLVSVIGDPSLSGLTIIE